ncbi:MAG: TonB-dependent receptor family protein, partial [Bacteroidia bacterium]|nr:TonB-dependent receptor family protein [Bacteroidia bacterium]
MLRTYALAGLLMGVGWAQPPGGMPGGRGGQGRQEWGRGEMEPPRSEAALKGTIRGILRDSVSKEPLPYVSVSLYRGDKLITGALTDEKGAFTLQEVPIGRYRLRMQPLGYAPTEKIVETTPLRPDLSLGTIYLTETGIELQTVEIQAEKSPIEYQPEKIVYNPERDATVQGGDALDVLRKVPAVNIDLDGRIEVRGSGAVRIYVDGKPSLLFANNPGDALRAIPSDQIERVELITNPSARYEAEGAVILNIVLKRNRLEGLTTTANAGVTNQFTNGSLTLGAKVGRWSHTLNAGGRYRYAGTGYTRFYRLQETPSGPITLRQNGDFLPRRFMTNVFYGGDFVRNAAQTFSWGANFRDLSFDRINDLYVSWEGGPWDGLQYLRSARSPQKDWGVNANLDYTHRFLQRPGSELFLSLQGGYGYRVQQYTLDQLSAIDTFFLRERSSNRGPSWEGQFQADYTLPFGQRWKLETGLRLNMRGLGTGFSAERYDRSSEIFIGVPGRQDTLTYTQWVPAAYASIAWAQDRWLLKGGFRYEYTYNDALFLQGTLPFTQRYQNLFPNLLLSYNVKGLFPLQLSYSQRIRRPWLQELNPFVDASDPRNIQYGNPDLGPELTHAIELSFFPFVTLFARYTTDAVQEYTFVDREGVTHTTFLNAGKRGFYGGNLFFRRTFFSDRVTFQANGELGWVDARADIGGTSLQNAGWQYSIRGSLQWRPFPSWLVELSGNYNSPRVSLQGLRPVFMFQELGIRKTFAEGKWAVGAIAYNPFYQYLRLQTRLEGVGF